MRILTLTLGAILTAYCSAGILSEAAWQNNEKAESALCLAFLCNNAPLVWRGRDLVTTKKKNNIEQSLTIFQEVLQRDPQDPYRWADLGEAFLDAGQKENARYCYSQVLALAPRTAPILLQVAEFHFEIGETKEALAITARILGLIPNYDSLVFNDYVRFVDHPDDVLRYGLPDDPRAKKAWLEFLIQSGRGDDAQRAWEWIARHGDADDGLAAKYVVFAIREGHPDLALSTWRAYLGTRAIGYGTSNYLFNGDFESEPSQSPFDWAIEKAEGVEVSRDCTSSWSGKCSLRIQFDGSHNLDFVAASQLSFVHPGHYRLRTHILTEKLTTDEGIRFRVLDAEMPVRLDEAFGQFTGNNPWSEISNDFVVGPGPRLVEIQVIRRPSLKFDNKIKGTAWVDDLSLLPIPGNAP